MAVYVDDMKAPYGRMIMCHMVADTLEELHEMADRIGLSRNWFQSKPNHPHNGISKGKRKMAIGFGAKEITQKDLILLQRGK